MEQEAIEILNFLLFSQNLKKQQRTIKLSSDRHESSADHSWHLALMVLVVVPKLQKKISLLRALKMALIHDLVEARIGDIPYGVLERDKEKKKLKKQNEEKEILKIKKLIGGELGKEICNLWHEFEDKKTNEAKLVTALDSLEANFQSILFDVGYWDDYFYEIALTKAQKHCEHEPILFELDKEITLRMEEEFVKAGLDLEKIKNGC